MQKSSLSQFKVPVKNNEFILLNYLGGGWGSTRLQGQSTRQAQVFQTTQLKNILSEGQNKQKSNPVCHGRGRKPCLRNINTFDTHLGLYRWRRLFSGVNSTSEIFQETIRQVTSGVSGVVNISDYILCSVFLYSNIKTPTCDRSFNVYARKAWHSTMKNASTTRS